MAPVTEIMHFKTTSSYLQDPSRWISELATQSPENIKGFSKAYLGFETEDPNIAFWWASLSAHDTYRQTDTFKATQAVAQQIFADTPTHAFVNFSDTSRIFSAPVTEFVISTLKEGARTPKFYGSSWATVVDKPNIIYGVLGWRAHWDAVSLDPLKKIIDEVKEVADIWLVHAKLTQYNA
ncbi:hypothetical protein BDR07DRAFT_1485799 [Suillus spraguei]|nr:hypothetical protein BDR07DRAFT_1485799 [Suillus spraguei]